MSFKPVMRFAVMSDIHYKDEPSVERERFACSLKTLYNYSEKSETYNKLDAIYVVGDFATSGSEIQMQAFKADMDAGLKEGTEFTITLASHEFNSKNGGEPAALQKLSRIFGMQPDTHKIINGFHFIAVTTTNGCRFDENKRKWISAELKKAAEDDPKKPIFFFQHPHLSGTVYGSINWGEDEINDILMNYPQIIDFSGHSHAPINDPRSIHQQYFTSLGTGTLSYFELDEFDKYYGTCPPGKEKAAQILIVEADCDNRVRIYPYDLITEQFFGMTWEIDEPSNPECFKYTDDRYKTDIKPYFSDNAGMSFSDITKTAATLTFNQAKIEKEYVNYYSVTVKEEKSGIIKKQIALWSEYYFMEMPETLSLDLNELSEKTGYIVEITAYSFWKTKSDNPLTGKFTTI